MASTLKEKTGQSWQDILERHEKHLNGDISDKEFQAAQRQLEERTKLSQEKLLEIGRSFIID